ncbi:MAG: tyrosine decarboxylase MfnA [Spirochaetales bacterium]|nr:tyrosine decarboxylase MfnA [Spirochaetales bacterium]
MEDKGKDQDIISAELKNRLMKDLTFNSGKILGSMCTRPHPFAEEIFMRYIEKNIGDPGLVNATEEIEKEAIALLGNLVGLRKAAGHIVTGGTEANILAMWTAKKRMKKKVRTPEVILSEDAHFSFDKAAELIGLKLKKIKVTGQFRIDIEKVKRALSPNTIAIVGAAGTTGLGVVDRIDELSAIALEADIHLHVDAAFGGYVLPFLKELGYEQPPFNFRLKGVSSMTIDPHKMGMAVIPAGGILYRTKELSETVRIPVPYLSGGENARATIVGTRSGASVLSVWSLLNHLGRQGYRTIIRRCMDSTVYLAEKIAGIEDVEMMIKPVINIAGITSKVHPVGSIAERLRKKGWAISLFPNHIRIVLMPHVYREHIDKFIDDLSDICAKLRGVS